jgi:hypothetical protein
MICGMISLRPHTGCDFFAHNYPHPRLFLQGAAFEISTGSQGFHNKSLPVHLFFEIFEATGHSVCAMALNQQPEQDIKISPSLFP